MSGTQTVRLYESTVEHVKEVTSLPEEATFAQKAAEILEGQGGEVELAAEVLEEVAEAVADEIEDRLKQGGW